MTQGENLAPISEQKTERMADERKTMVEYAQPTLGRTGSCIVQPAIQANNFEIKASTMNMVQHQCQFDGLTDEDPHAHIQMFLDICEIVKQNGVSDEALIASFPFHLERESTAMV